MGRRTLRGRQVPIPDDVYDLIDDACDRFDVPRGPLQVYGHASSATTIGGFYRHSERMIRMVVKPDDPFEVRGIAAHEVAHYIVAMQTDGRDLRHSARFWRTLVLIAERHGLLNVRYTRWQARYRARWQNALRHYGYHELADIADRERRVASVRQYIMGEEGFIAEKLGGDRHYTVRLGGEVIGTAHTLNGCWARIYRFRRERIDAIAAGSSD